jgi:tRNA-dihydrouridine synthase
VLGNGDIKTAEDASRMHEQTRCAGIMIARGSYGQPWIFDQVKDLLAGRPKRPAPPVEERFAIALRHARLVMAYETDPRGAAIEFRKHLGWYSKGLHGSAELRKKLYAVTSFGEVEGIFADYLANAERYRDLGEPGDAGGEFAEDAAHASSASEHTAASDPKAAA